MILCFNCSCFFYRITLEHIIVFHSSIVNLYWFWSCKEFWNEFFFMVFVLFTVSHDLRLSSSPDLTKTTLLCYLSILREY